LLADRELLKLLLDCPTYAQLFPFAECGGLFAGDIFLAWLAEKFEAKGIGAKDTMAAFFEKKRVDLSVVVSDTTAGEMLVINHRTAPDVPLAMAVRMSMSILLYGARSSGNRVGARTRVVRRPEMLLWTVECFRTSPFA
jgi:hypothetical protein